MKTRPARTVKQVLIAMKWIIENIGWTKGAFFRNHDGFSMWAPSDDLREISACCLSGAKNLVETSPKTSEKTAELLDSLCDPQNFVAFNDDPDTTKRDVLDLLNEAIVRAR